MVKRTRKKNEERKEKMKNVHLRYSLSLLQTILKNWLNYNFPESTSDDQFKGVVEEIGELARADLKHIQGIRGFDNEEKYESKMKDAIGDIVIYLINYCTRKNIKFYECIELAIEEIMKRDWIKNTLNGKNDNVS